MLTLSCKETLYDVKRILDFYDFSTHMSLILGEASYYKNPLPDYNSVFVSIKKLPLKIQGFFNFLSLGIPIKRSELSCFFDDHIVNDLKLLDLLNYDDEYVWLNNYILVSYMNCYVFVGNVYYYPTCQSKEQIPYIGPDSYWLSRMICNHTSGVVLDLCSGSGIQAILSAKNAEKVVAIDIDPRAVEMIQINACLNKLDHKIEVREGDLYNVIKDGEIFDYITANPPFIPIPDDISFPLAGDGGALGDVIIKNILTGSMKHLSSDGELIMIGQVIGESNRPFLSELVKRSIDSGWINLTYHSRTLIEHQALESAKLTNLLNQEDADSKKWLDNYAKVGATCFYSFLLKIKKCDTTIFNEFCFDDSWLDSDIPISKSSWKKAYDSYALSHNGRQNIIVDEEMIEFLKMVDGKKSVSQIVESMPFKYKVRYGDNSRTKMLVKYMALCSFLEHNSIITKQE